MPEQFDKVKVKLLKSRINLRERTWAIRMIWGYDITYLCLNLFWPLIKILIGMCIGLFLAALLEYTGWTNLLAKIFRPLIKFGNLGNVSGAAFSAAFISPYAANGLLSEAWQAGKLTKSELVFSYICNSFPASVVHLPTLFFIAWPVLGYYAVILAGMNLAAALGRASLTLLASHFLLKRSENLEKLANDSINSINNDGSKTRLQKAAFNAWLRFRKRILKLVSYTAPFYFLMWICKEQGLFEIAQSWLVYHSALGAYLSPEAISLVMLQMLAETGAGLGAAGAILENAALSGKEVVIALLLGNIMATPLRAIRHQFPALAGFYKPKLAFLLVVFTQLARAVSLSIALAFYY